jgi:cell division protein FtsB
MAPPQNTTRTRRCLAQLGRVGEAVYNGRTKVATCAAGLLALMVGYHVVFGQNGLTAYQTKRRDARDLQVQVQELKLDNDRLKAHVDRLTNDPDAIEHEAREELHYTRPGEVIYTMPAERK